MREALIINNTVISGSYEGMPKGVIHTNAVIFLSVFFFSKI